MSELVHIINPDLPGAKSSIQVGTAFEKVWEKRGWKIVSAQEAIAHDEAVAAGEPAAKSGKSARAAGGEG